MEEQLGAKFMQFTLGLEGCCLIGPWGVGRGASDLAGLLAKPHTQPASSLPDKRTDPPPPGTPSPRQTPRFWPGHLLRPNQLGPGAKR